MIWSSESAGFSFAFHEFEDITNAHWTLDVSDEVSLVGFLSGDEDDLHLGDATAGASASQQLSHSRFHRLWFHGYYYFIKLIHFSTEGVKEVVRNNCRFGTARDRSPNAYCAAQALGLSLRWYWTLPYWRLALLALLGTPQTKSFQF